MRPERAVNSVDEATGLATARTSIAGFHLGDDFARLRDAAIMMIDDEPVMLEVVQTFLELTGYRRFIKVEQSVEAVDKVRERRPDVLLIGAMISGVSEFDVLEALRADPEFAHLPIIVLGSFSEASGKLRLLDLGVTDFLSKPVDPIDLALRVRNALAARAYQDQLAYFDRLTGLPKRQLFHDRVDWAIARARRERTKLALLHVTFDEFKQIAGTFGPEAGNDVLRQLVGRLTSRLRASDVVSRDVSEVETGTDVFRLGRTEFSVLLPVIDSIAGAVVVGQRILAAMREPLDAGGTEVRLAPSIGVSGFPDDAGDATSLIQLAIGASAQAIAQGGGRLQFFSPEMNRTASEWLRMEADLRSAVDGGELTLLYQPKIDVSTGAVVGAEALMRWPRPDGVCVSPTDFVSVAQESGMILQLGEWAMREACRQAAQWRDQGVDIKMAVNISVQQFFDAGLATLVQSILEETGLGPGVMTLEITEGILINRVSQALPIIADLRAVGVGISIDDFGTGYSSLGYLRRFEVDEVKIDKTLIADVVASHRDRALVYAVTYLARQFGFRVCAEGVEDESQLKILRKIKCDQYQGYLFNRPMDPQTFVDRYRQRRG